MWRGCTRVKRTGPRSAGQTAEEQRFRRAEQAPLCACSLKAAIELNGEPRKAMADQIATVSKLRLKSKAGTLGDDDIRAVERAIRVQLGL